MSADHYSPQNPDYYLAAVYLDEFHLLDSFPPQLDQTDIRFSLAQAIKHSKAGQLDVSKHYWDIFWLNPKPKNSLKDLALLEYATHQVRISQLGVADSIYQILLEQISNDQLTDSILMAAVFEQKGLLDCLTSNYTNSQDYLEKSGSLWEILNQNHPWRASYQNHYGILLTALGKYDEAEETLFLARKLATMGGKGYENIFYDATSNLGTLYRLLGDFSNAEVFYNQAGEWYQRKGLYLEYATSLNNIGLIYDELDSIEVAIDYLKKAAAVYEEKLGTQNQTYATLLNNLAGLLDYQEDYDQAVSFYQQAIQTVESTLGIQNIYYTTMLNNLALTYENIGEPSSAEPLYLKAIKIRKQVLGDQHPLYAELLYNLASLYSYYYPEKALTLFKECNQLELRLMKYYYATFDEATRINYLDDIQIAFEKYYSLAVQLKQKSTLVDMANFSIATKGLASEYSRDLRKLFDNPKNQANHIFNSWLILRDSLAKVLVMNNDQRNSKDISIQDLVLETEQLEKEWIRDLELSMSPERTYIQLINSMKSDEVIIDFIHFEQFKNGEWTDTIWYYAILIDPEKTVPEIIKMIDEPSIKRLLDQGLSHQNMDAQLNALSEIVLNPLLPYLSGKKKISISPSGVLYRIPFPGLVANRQYLGQKYEIEIFSHLRNFSENHEDRRHSGLSALLIGGLNFGSFQQMNVSFPFLPGTKLEIEQIASKLNTKGWKLHTLVGNQATRSKTMSLMTESSAHVIHLATHGFSYEYVHNNDIGDLTLRNRIATSTNPLLRSGVALSEINAYWSAENQFIEDESGILTAFDIANIQLPQTKLVFLSACESGVGDIHSKEGVFGLPRSFQLAGADQVIYTLWNIDDQITNKFVHHFYKKFVRHQNTKKAFRWAQIKMARKHNPYFWSGFTLLN